jgi:hypothetical protein
MLRALLYGLAILHLGPGIAFAVLAFGCDPSRPMLGAVCQGNTLAVFLSLTVTLWLMLGAGTAAVLALRRRPRKGAAVIDA